MACGEGIRKHFGMQYKDTTCIFGSVSIPRTMLLLDDVNTWPSSVVDIIESNKKACQDYLNAKEGIDTGAAKNISNPYNKQWCGILSKLGIAINDLHVIGFHCTRLTDEEIENIRSGGLEPLTPELIERRLSLLRQQNSITKADYTFLLNNNRSNDDNRKGKVWFFLNSKTLTKESALCRLFRSWGGESIYWGKENDKRIEHIFKTGKPCIVLGELYVRELDLLQSVPSMLVKIYLNQNMGIVIDADCCITRRVTVVHIIQHGEKLFEQLTGFSRWNL
nr:hypothetical protein [uncultured bacterium]